MNESEFKNSVASARATPPARFPLTRLRETNSRPILTTCSTKLTKFSKRTLRSSYVTTYKKAESRRGAAALQRSRRSGTLVLALRQHHGSQSVAQRASQRRAPRDDRHCSSLQRGRRHGRRSPGHRKLHCES